MYEVFNSSTKHVGMYEVFKSSTKHVWMKRVTFVDINDFTSRGYFIRQPNRFSTVAAREGGGEEMKRRTDQ